MTTPTWTRNTYMTDVLYRLNTLVARAVRVRLAQQVKRNVATLSAMRAEDSDGVEKR